MDEAGKKRLLEEYAANKRPETREQLILEYAPLVKAVAGRLSMYLGYNVDLCQSEEPGSHSGPDP